MVCIVGWCEYGSCLRITSVVIVLLEIQIGLSRLGLKCHNVDVASYNLGSATDSVEGCYRMLRKKSQKKIEKWRKWGRGGQHQEKFQEIISLILKNKNKLTKSHVIQFSYYHSQVPQDLKLTHFVTAQAAQQERSKNKFHFDHNKIQT